MPTHTNGGRYEPAIRHWEHVLARPAPPPTCLGRNGAPVLSPDFVEWMMGMPPDWTNVPGISRTARLRLLGNSVVIAQAAGAFTELLGITSALHEDGDTEPTGVTVEVPLQLPELNDQAAALVLRILIEHCQRQGPTTPFG